MKAFLRAIALVSFGIASSLAQNANGRIAGIVTDPQGAVIPGASITVTNTATNDRRRTVSGPDGTYQVLNLPIGTYTVSAEHAGFTKLLTDPQQLLINQTLRIDIPLSIGRTTETVVVQAEGSNVETVNSTIGQSVTG